MTMSAVAFIAELQDQLNDETGVYWEPEEIQNWVNQMQRTMCLWKKDSYVKTVMTNLVVGPKQTLPADGAFLFDIVRNKSGFGGTVTRVDYKDLPRNWPEKTIDAALGIKHYMYNPSHPTEYYIYPNYAASTSNQLEIVYGAVPPLIDVYINGDELKGSPSNTSLVVRDVGALHDGVMGRCCLKQTGHAMAERAAMYLGQFDAAIGKAAAATMAADPNRTVDKRVEDGVAR